jgi:hypothetical protein
LLKNDLPSQVNYQKNLGAWFHVEMEELSMIYNYSKSGRNFSPLFLKKYNEINSSFLFVEISSGDRKGMQIKNY